MFTIIENIRYEPSERDKYTSYEIGSLIKNKRLEQNLSQEETAINFGLSLPRLNNIELGHQALSVRDYNFISSFLDIPIDELLTLDVDQIDISYRTTHETDSMTIQAIEKANQIFDEFIFQKKINA